MAWLRMAPQPIAHTGYGETDDTIRLLRVAVDAAGSVAE